MANEQELSQQLQALQDRAEQQHNLAESSRELLHRNLAETYFWWREARNEAGYLDRLYAEHNITYRNTGNRHNFSPVIRLACPSSKHLAQIWRGGNGEQASSGVCF